MTKHVLMLTIVTRPTIPTQGSAIAEKQKASGPLVMGWSFSGVPLSCLEGSRKENPTRSGDGAL
jgi:hypothetical protein